MLSCSMADEKPITIPALIGAMKEAGFATRSDVEEIVDQRITSRGLATRSDVEEIVTKKSLETADAILEGQAPIYERLDQIDGRLDKLEMGQARLEVAQAHTTDEVKGLKADLSDTSSRVEVNNLKARVIALENRH